VIRSEESWILYSTDHTAQSTLIICCGDQNFDFCDSFWRMRPIVLYRSNDSKKFISVVVSGNSTFPESFLWIGTILLYRSHGSKSVISVAALGISMFRHSSRRIGTIALYRSHGSNKLHYCLACGISTFRGSFDESGIMYYIYHTAQTSFISVVANGNSTFCDSIRRIGNFVLYRSHGSNKLLCCCCARNFDISRFVPINQDPCTVQIARLKLALFLLWCLEIRPFVIRSSETGLLYCTDHTAQTSFISVVGPEISIFRDGVRRIGTIVLHGSQGSNKLHLCCGVRKFELS
jgi:hypothetical protein